MSIILIVNEKRKEIGMSKIEFSQKAEISRQYLDMIEKNRSMPSVLVLCKIADVLGCSLNELVKKIN